MSRNEFMALFMGFGPSGDDGSLVKDGKKWISDIEALKRQLGGCTDEDLREQNYDVDDYYLAESEEFQESDVMDALDNESKGSRGTGWHDYGNRDLYYDIGGDGDEPMYLGDGVWLGPDGSAFEQ